MKLSELSLSNMSGGAFPAGSHHHSQSQLGQSAGGTMQQQQQQPKILNESNNVVYTNALSASQLFQEKLRNESQAYYQHKNIESKIRSDVGKTAEEMLARTQMIESKYFSEAKENAKVLETTLEENNRRWEAAMASKQEEIEKYKRSLLETEKRYEDEIKNMKKSFEQLLENKDSHWKNILIDVENKARREMESLKDRISLDNEAKAIAGEARCEAAESKAQAVFDKKLKRYEKQVTQILERFEDRKLKYEGALEEVRRQLRETTEITDKKVAYLHEELVLKEKRITSIVGKIQQHNALTAEMNRWREIAKELAMMVNKMSQQVIELPAAETLVSDEEKSRGDSAIDEALLAFMASKESKDKSSNSELKKRIKEYKTLRKTNFAISKKCISKLAKCSQRIIEESEASKGSDGLFPTDEDADA